MNFDIFLQTDTWIALVTLTFLEIVLGIDNIIFVTIAADKLPQEQQKRARNIGFILAMVLRIAMLFGISFLLAAQEPIFEFHTSVASGAFSIQSLILLAGGIFLLYKSTVEIYHKVEGVHEEGAVKKKGRTLTGVILQIAVINLVFSFDSILTAIGLVQEVMIMIIAVVLSVLVMMVFAGPVGRFVNKHPTVQILGLAFLILIGFMLVTESLHLAHFDFGGKEVGEIPKGYLYTAILFSFSVELLNMRIRGGSKKKS